MPREIVTVQVGQCGNQVGFTLTSDWTPVLGVGSERTCGVQQSNDIR